MPGIRLCLHFAALAPAPLTAVVRHSTRPMTETRPLRRRIFLPDWVWAILLPVTILISLVTSPLWPLVGLAAVLLAQGIYAFHLVRCPACQARLRFRRGSIPGTSRYHVQLACGKCGAVWNTGRVCDDTISDGGVDGGI